MSKRRVSLLSGLLCGVAIGAAGCGKSTNVVNAAPPPAVVSVVQVQPQTVPIYAAYAAQTFASRFAVR
jgi:hypothetical protein